MKLPPDRFEELVSLYLDNEASDAELRTLVECVKSDPEAAKKLKESVKIHMATCKLYGKKCRLRNLAELPAPAPSRAVKPIFSKCLEWSKLAALIMLSFGMLKYTFATNTQGVNENETGVNSLKHLEKIDSYDVNIRKGNNFHMENAFTVIEFSPKSSKELQ